MSLIKKEKARLMAKEIRRSLIYDQAVFAEHFSDQFFKYFRLDDLGVTAFYWPLPQEADPREIAYKIQQTGLETCLPSIHSGQRAMSFYLWREGDDLVKSDFEIMIPKNCDHNNTVLPQTLIVPLLAVNKLGQRIGFGKGHYDATIAALRNANVDGLKTIGLAYDEQVLDLEWEINDYDVALNYLCTPSRVIKF